MEAWVRGLYQKFAKFPYGYFRTVGSNPTASANSKIIYKIEKHTYEK